MIAQIDKKQTNKKSDKNRKPKISIANYRSFFGKYNKHFYTYRLKGYTPKKSASKDEYFINTKNIYKEHYPEFYSLLDSGIIKKIRSLFMDYIYEAKPKIVSLNHDLSNPLCIQLYVIFHITATHKLIIESREDKFLHKESIASFKGDKAKYANFYQRARKHSKQDKLHRLLSLASRTRLNDEDVFRYIFASMFTFGGFESFREYANHKKHDEISMYYQHIYTMLTNEYFEKSAVMKSYAIWLYNYLTLVSHVNKHLGALLQTVSYIAHLMVSNGSDKKSDSTKQCNGASYEKRDLTENIYIKHITPLFPIFGSNKNKQMIDSKTEAKLMKLSIGGIEIIQAKYLIPRKPDISVSYEIFTNTLKIYPLKILEKIG